jgi:ABC-type polysaccharide/polyol phosphate transport system ATPase subunit
MSAAPPILLEEAGVRYDLRLTKKRSFRRSLISSQRLDAKGHFWALRNINLRVNAGESVAVIGPNGAGKSTLLKMLAGIITPDEGRAEVRGKIATLLQLSAGFEDELNAEENILLVGELLGIPAPKMKKKIPAILEFADIGSFAGAELRTYSSGMRARLGFSVATSVNPDVLLLDEVLSTGDETFKVKSGARIREMAKVAQAIVYVTHDLESAKELCARAIELRDGRIVADGPAASVIADYKKRTAKVK